MKKKQDLKDKVIVITGASSGIGRATALEFARRGARLVLASRREDALAEVVSECVGLGATDAIYVKTDVTEAAAVQELAKAAHAFGGRVDVWVNNAGVGAVGEFTKTPIEAHEQVIKTNLLGEMHGAHAVLPYFKEQEAGILINVISVGGWVAQPYTVAYSASKFGLRGYSEALRGELHQWPGIHVCDVFPAFIDTPGFQHGGNYVGRKVKPAPPVYDPQRVADAIVSLAKHPKDSVTVGTSATMLRISHALFPKFTRLALARMMERYFKQAEPEPVSDNSLFEPHGSKTGISGGWRSSSNGQSKTLTGAAVTAGLATMAGLYFLSQK